MFLKIKMTWIPMKFHALTKLDIKMIRSILREMKSHKIYRYMQVINETFQFNSYPMAPLELTWTLKLVLTLVSKRMG